MDSFSEFKKLGLLGSLDEEDSPRIKRFEDAGLMGCFNGTGVTSENCKEVLDGPKWISVNERLPEKGGRYLVFIRKGNHMHNCLAFDYPLPCCEPNIAYYSPHCSEWRWHSMSEQKCDPTDWMQLPEPPK